MANEQAIEMECGLLGAIIGHSEHAHLLLDMTEHDFANPDNRRIYAAMRRMHEAKRPIDMLLLMQELPADAVTLLSYARKLSSMGTPWHAERYAKELHKLGEKRRFYKLMKACADRLEEGVELEVVMDECRQQMTMIGERGGGFRTLGEMGATLYEHSAERREGKQMPIKTGMDRLDKTLGGFYNEDLVIVAARPAVGKSSFGIALALSAARAGKRTAIFSFEMSDDQYAARVASEITGINGMRLKNGDLSELQWAAYADAVMTMYGLPILVDSETRTFEQMRRSCYEHAGEIDMVIVDYIQIVDTKKPFGDDRSRISFVSRSLKQLAKELHIPIVALAQIKRQEGVADRMPVIKELKGSGSIEEDADKIIFLHEVTDAADPYAKDYQNTLRRCQQNKDRLIAINVAKHRDGATGWLPSRFEPGKMRFHMIIDS